MGEGAAFDARHALFKGVYLASVSEGHPSEWRMTGLFANAFAKTAADAEACMREQRRMPVCFPLPWQGIFSFLAGVIILSGLDLPSTPPKV